MNITLKNTFSNLWKKYFNVTELPIVFYYTNEKEQEWYVEPGSTDRCIISALSDVREGHLLCFDIESVGCFGGKRYLGFTDRVMPDFEYFLSYGIPGKLEGERHKKSPDLVKDMMKHSTTFQAPGRFIVFKRWDMLEEIDNPEVVIFFAQPDTLSGLFMLANYDVAKQDAVFTPFGSGCSTIVQYPYLEKDSNHPRAVIGMFDVSARPFVPDNILTFTVPMNKFIRMVDNMDESFLMTGSWKKIQKRIRE